MSEKSKVTRLFPIGRVVIRDKDGEIIQEGCIAECVMDEKEEAIIITNMLIKCAEGYMNDYGDLKLSIFINCLKEELRMLKNGELDEHLWK